MKLINYNYGYRQLFGCSIHGRIIVNPDEWRKCLKYLSRLKPDTSYPFYKTMVKDDANRAIHTKKGDLFNLRVWATEKIVSRFNLKGYKRANYEFLVTK